MQDVDILRSEWWVLILRGFAAILFGFAALIWPGITLGVLVLLVALIVGVLGVADIITGVRWLIKTKWNGFMWLVLGFLEIGVAVFFLRRIGTGIAVLTFVLLLSLALIVRGLVSLVEAFDRKVATATRWLSIIMGLLAIVAGVVITVYPDRATLAFVWVLGLYALIIGAMEIALGLMAKEVVENTPVKKR